MEFVGRVWQSGQLWNFEIPCFDAMSCCERFEEVESLTKDMITGYIRADLSIKMGQDSLSVQIENGIIRVKRPAGSLPLIALMISRLRRQAGFTQRELAEKIGLATHRSIVNVETGKHMPDVDNLQKIMDVLGSTMEVTYPSKRTEVNEEAA